MAKRGGFGGGMMPGNMKNLMKQAQKMQAQMEEQQKALEEKVFEATAGGGAVKIAMTGKRQVTALTIDPEACDPEDVEDLQDMVIAAFNEVLSKVDEETSSQLSKMTGGLGGLGGGLF